MEQQKITTLDAIGPQLGALRANETKVVLCHGVFDLLHIGHIKHFNQAKQFGDVLVVSLTADKFVNKGPNRPAFNQQLRAEAIAALDCVDYVVVNNSESAVPAIEAVRPSFYVKGKEYRDRPQGRPGRLRQEEEAIKKIGGELVYTDDVVFSSSNLINSYMNPYPEHISNYLSSFKAAHSTEYFTDLFDQMRKLKVLVVGETIIDVYNYVETLGKSGKEPVLVAREMNSERFAGGVLAIANNIAGFCNNVGILSCMGAQATQEDFIRKNLRPQVTPLFHLTRERPTITKTRFVEAGLLQKLFEVYTIDEDRLPNDEDAALCEEITRLGKEYDVVVVADYGHGMLSESAVKALCSSSKFLAVNTQTNAGNRGFNTISKYPRADYVSISEPELRLEMRQRKGDARDLISQLRTYRDYGGITVTRGKSGMLSFSKNGGFAEAPALTQSFVDRVGSGDAVLAVTSPLAALGAPPDVLAFIGNVAGAEAVGIVGHRSFLEYSPFMRHIQSALK